LDTLIYQETEGDRSELHKRQKLENKEALINPDTGTFDSQKRGRKQFDDFVSTTYQRLVECESKRLGGKSSLTVFARIDVGIYIDKEGKASYFVNEVERTGTTSLWLRTTGIPLHMTAATLGKSLGEWMDSI
jgi:hypothetical protein